MVRIYSVDFSCGFSLDNMDPSVRVSWVPRHSLNYDNKRQMPVVTMITNCKPHSILKNIPENEVFCDENPNFEIHVLGQKEPGTHPVKCPKGSLNIEGPYRFQTSHIY